LAVSVFCPPQTFHFTGAFCFLSQVAPDSLGSTAPDSKSPAWTVVPAGRSVLVVARGGQWARARWDATFPRPGLKLQPPSNVWAPPTPGAGCWPPLPCCHLSLGPPGEGSGRQTMPSRCPASTWQDAAWSVVGSVRKGSTGDAGAGAKAYWPHLAETDQCFPEIGGELGMLF